MNLPLQINFSHWVSYSVFSFSGWSGNPVSSKRYHFIVKADGNSIGGYNKPCTCCGDVLHLSESR